MSTSSVTPFDATPAAVESPASRPASMPADLAPEPAPAVGLTLPERAMRAALRSAPTTFGAAAVLTLAAASAVGKLTFTSIDAAWLAAMLVVLGLRFAHVAWARASLPPPPVLRWVPQYLVGAGLTTLGWALLPWLQFTEATPAGRLVAMSAIVAAAFAEALALRAMPRPAMLLGAALVLPAGCWQLLAGGAGAVESAVVAGAALAVHAALCISRERAMRATISAEQEADRLARREAEREARMARIESELARAQNALGLAEADAREQRTRAEFAMTHGGEVRMLELEKRSLDLAREAVTDPLTMLPNRKGINEALVELLGKPEDAGRYRDDEGPEMALLFLDLDEFKQVNDQLGHLAGDAVLKVAAERLRESVPRAGFAARWGGDEFIVALPGLSRVEQVRMVAEKLRAELCVPIRLEEGTVRIGASIGIALAPYHGRTPEALIIAADHAVYAAKTEGRDRVRVFDVALAKKAQRQHQIAQALPGALDGNQLAIVYQPIVGPDGTATHVEALARWPHPKWGAVSPGEFIPLAEQNGQIHAMGRWVLRQACRDAARWPGINPPKLSVNVSAMQVSSGHLVSQVREALAASKLPPGRLVIELTESLPMARSEGVSQTLQDLREMGVTLALDDFGTGYSSLSSLMKQPVSLVKIDQSFVKDVPGGGEVLIKATVDVARRFGLEVVAEGVETAVQRSALESLGVQYMQGWLFGRPMPNEEFIAWLGLRDGGSEPFVLRA